MGAIPIISKYWNGASPVDFPGVLRVDPGNASDIEHTLSYALANYEYLLQKKITSQFLTYILSLFERARETTLLLASSASIHFLIYANGLQQEQHASLHALALIYLFPLASIDIIVSDVNWFIR